MRTFVAVLALILLIAIPSFTQTANAAPVSPASSAFGGNGYTSFDSPSQRLWWIAAVARAEDARIAHEMLAGRPHRRGKIVLDIDSRL
jgi:hypothetical protein